MHEGRERRLVGEQVFDSRGHFFAAAAEAMAAAGIVPPEAARDIRERGAVTRLREGLGPVDVWVNVAFTSVFSPFDQITPAEFKVG